MLSNLPNGPKGPRSMTLPCWVHGDRLNPAIIQTSVLTIVSGRPCSSPVLHLGREKMGYVRAKNTFLVPGLNPGLCIDNVFRA